MARKPATRPSPPARRQRSDSPMRRAVWWGQVGNFIAFVIGLTGAADKTVLIWGAMITLIASIAGT